MEKKIFAVTGATGNVGRVVSENLLRQGHEVRAIGRSKERLQPLVDLGANPKVGSLEDPAFVAAAFKNANGVFAMIPPNYGVPDFFAYQSQIGENLARAIENAGVRHVVTLSSIGAEQEKGTGPIKGLHWFEERLNQIPGVNVVHLRPASFMENLLFGIDTIRNLGINGSAVKADLPIAMIATRDIGNVAAELLENLNFRGKSVRELQGAADITMTDATSVVGRAIGKPDLKYIQFPYDQLRKALAGMGMSTSAIESLVELYDGINEGLIKPLEVRSESNTTPTTIEEFSQTFAQAYHSGAAASAG